jgi:hypothetical protein
MLEQAACDELLGRLHHVLPHLELSPLLIEECESLLSAYRTPLAHFSVVSSAKV